MNIQTKILKIETEKEVKTALYSVEDIKQLIVNDIEQQGYKTKLLDVTLVTNWTYESDEWGLNNHVVAKFMGANVKVYNKESEGEL